jgi:hypothetical protein
MRFFISIFLLSTLFSSGLVGAATHGYFKEEVFIRDTKHLNKFLNRPGFIIDHVSTNGFELYGPKGLQKYLNVLRIPFEPAIYHNHKKVRDYPTFSQIEKKLKELAKKYPNIAKLSSIGKSVEGRNLYVMKISDNVNVDEIEPEFKYISSMHGDEITGRELCVFLIEDILKGYDKDTKITALIDSTEIYIMPSMNPDGSAKTQRANANGFDLNRNFPDWKRGDPNQIQKQQPETKAIMQFQSERNFSLSANFHGGAVVVNYPWDNTYERHPLDQLVQDISLAYANLNSEMRNSREFPRGITNGADWYKVYGGMQDWSYFWYGDLQITVELSEDKWPSYRSIPTYYQRNKASMIKYLELVHQGFGFHFQDFHQKGRVEIFQKHGSTLEPMGEFVFGNSEYYKVLPLGEYRVLIKRTGHPTVSKDIIIDQQIHHDGYFLKL